MSINITVTVPLETLAATSSGDPGRRDAIETIVKSVMQSLEGVPYAIAPEAMQTDLVSRQREPSVTTAGDLASPSTNVDDDAHKEIEVYVKTSTGKISKIKMLDSYNWYDFAAVVRFKEAISEHQMELVYRGKSFWTGSDPEKSESSDLTLKQAGQVLSCAHVNWTDFTAEWCSRRIDGASDAAA